jgi:hypothetical protein
MNLNKAVGFFKLNERGLDLKSVNMSEMEQEEEENLKEVLKEDTSRPERERSAEPETSPITNLGKEFDLDNYEKF